MHPEYIDIGSTESKVIEECGEVLQALMKVNRFGWFSYHPDRPHNTNMMEVQLEIDDLRVALDNLEDHMVDVATQTKEIDILEHWR